LVLPLVNLVCRSRRTFRHKLDRGGNAPICRRILAGSSADLH
jgi:hypothetical protein